MNYLIAYLAVGGIILLVMIGFHQYDKYKNKSDADALIKAVTAQWENKTWWDYFLEWVIVPLIAIPIVILAWPGFLLWLAKDKWWQGKTAAAVVDEEFAVTLDHLQQRKSLEENESSERISDPLHAVPDLPFGHMNAAWVQFKDDLQPGDEVWSFSVPWTKWGSTELHEGYVILRGGEIGSWLTAVIRQVDSKD